MRSMLWGFFRATPIYYFLRHVLTPVLAHASLGTPFLPQACLRLGLYAVLLGCVSTAAAPQAIDAFLLQQIQDAQRTVQESARRVEELEILVTHHNNRLRALEVNAALLPGIRDRIDETQDDVQWIMRSAIGQLVAFAVCMGVYIWRRRHNGKTTK